MLASDRLTVVEFEETANVSRHEIRNPKRGTPTLYVLPRRNEMWLPRKKGMDVFALDTGKFEKSVDDLPRPLMVLSATD